MARSAFRMLVSAGVGALLGLSVWLKGQTRSAWMGDALGLYGHSLAVSVLGGAVIGALLAFILDAIGLDLPLFPERRSRSAEKQELLFSAYLASLRSAARRGTAPPPPPAPAPESIRATIRDWSSGSAEGWIDRDTADRIQDRLRYAQIRMQLLLAASVSTLIGIGASMFHALTAGAFGTPGAGLPFFAIALACCIAVFVLGGTAWRLVAAVYGLAIAWAAYFFLF